MASSCSSVRQVLYAEMFVAIRQDQAAFDHVLQLPNVARPVMFGQGVQELQSETVKPFVVGLRERLQEILREQRNVFRSLPQGRHVDAHHGNTEVQIFPKGAFLHHFFQIAAGGADDPDVDGMRGIRAQTFQTAFLQHAQQAWPAGASPGRQFRREKWSRPGPLRSVPGAIGWRR